MENYIEYAEELLGVLRAALSDNDERALHDTSLKIGELLEQYPDVAKLLKSTDKEVLAFYLRGNFANTDAAVAKLLGYNRPASTGDAIERYRVKHLALDCSEIDALVMREHVRHEDLVNAIMEKARDGNFEAIKTYIALSRSIRDLLGLDAPKKGVVAHLDADDMGTVLVLPEKDIIDLEPEDLEDIRDG